MSKTLFLIFGPPGSGKGTQAEFLAKSQKAEHISTGDLIRETIERGDPVSEEISSFVQKGELVPDSLIDNILQERLEKVEGNAILDGYPRTIKQLDKTLDFAQKKGYQIILLNIILDKETAGERILKRKVCSKCREIYLPPVSLGKICPKCGGELITRKDDDKETFKKRYEIFNQEISPLFSQVQDDPRVRKMDINGDGTIEEIREEINRKLRNDNQQS